MNSPKKNLISLTLLILFSQLIGCTRSTNDDRIQELSRQLQEHTADATLYYERSRLYNEMHRFDDELNDLTKAIELDSSLVDARARRATLYFVSKNYTKALEDYSRLPKLTDLDRLNQGVSNTVMGKYKSAKEDFNMLMLHDSTWSTPLFADPYILSGDIDDAIKLLLIARENVKDSFNSKIINLRLVDLYMIHSQYNESLNIMNGSLFIRKTPSIALTLRRGVCFFHLGELAKSREDFLNATLIGDSTGLAEYYLGILLLLEHKTEEAVIKFEVAKKNNFQSFDLLRDYKILTTRTYESERRIADRYLSSPYMKTALNKIGDLTKKDTLGILDQRILMNRAVALLGGKNREEEYIQIYKLQIQCLSR